MMIEKDAGQLVRGDPRIITMSDSARGTFSLPQHYIIGKPVVIVEVAQKATQPKFVYESCSRSRLRKSFPLSLST